MNNNISIEPYGGGFILADYSGKRGKVGASYCGSDNEWRDQPVGMTPFKSEQLAKEAIKFATNLLIYKEKFLKIGMIDK